MIGNFSWSTITTCMVGAGLCRIASNIRKWSFYSKILATCPEMLLKPFPAGLLNPFLAELLCESQAPCCPFPFQMLRKVCPAPSADWHTPTAFIAYKSLSCLARILSFPRTTFYYFFKLRSEHRILNVAQKQLLSLNQLPQISVLDSTKYNL